MKDLQKLLDRGLEVSFGMNDLGQYTVNADGPGFDGCTSVANTLEDALAGVAEDAPDGDEVSNISSADVGGSGSLQPGHGGEHEHAGCSWHRDGEPEETLAGRVEDLEDRVEQLEEKFDTEMVLLIRVLGDVLATHRPDGFVATRGDKPLPDGT